MDYFQKSLEVHKELQWKIETRVKTPLETKDDLSIAYSPWVAAPCNEIAADVSKAYDYTLKANTVAVISDGSSVLWLWNIGPEASLPVMEGKCALFKSFSWVNAFPIVLDTQDTEEIIKTVKNIAPGFWAINLEDISAPRCFEIERRLQEELNIPVFHDDQDGTAIVTLAWIINSLKITGKNKETVTVTVNGAGAAGVAVTNLLLKYGIKNIIVVDSKWAIYKWREWMNPTKEILAKQTNIACLDDSEWVSCVTWWLAESVKGRDLFVGVSIAWVLTEEMVQSMAPDPIIFWMANPEPEIMPELAKKAWAKIVATWRSDYPNQINNVLVFPGLFKWALKYRVENITDDMKIKAAIELAAAVENPSVDEIIPSPFDPRVVDIITESVRV